MIRFLSEILTKNFIAEVILLIGAFISLFGGYARRLRRCLSILKRIWCRYLKQLAGWKIVILRDLRVILYEYRGVICRLMNLLSSRSVNEFCSLLWTA